MPEAAAGVLARCAARRGVTGEFVIRPCVTLCLGEVLKSRAFPPETGSQSAFRAEIRPSSTAVGGFGAACAVWLPRRVPVCSAAGRGRARLSVPTVAATVRTGAASVRPVAASVCGVLAVSGGGHPATARRTVLRRFARRSALCREPSGTSGGVTTELAI